MPSGLRKPQIQKLLIFGIQSEVLVKDTEKKTVAQIHRYLLSTQFTMENQGI